MELDEYRQRVEKHLPKVLDLLNVLDAAVHEHDGEGTCIPKVLQTHEWDDTLQYLAVAANMTEGESTDVIVLDQIQRHCAATHIETIKVIASFLPQEHEVRMRTSALIRSALTNVPLARRAES